MNNMPPSEVSKGFSQGQIRVLQKLLERGLRGSTLFQHAPTEQVDQFVKTVGSRRREVAVELLERQFRDFKGIFSVPVNYGEPDAIAKAIETAGFDKKYLGIPLADIPLVGKGQVVHEAREAHFGRVMYNCDLPAAVKERGQELGFKAGFKFADPLTALRFACANRDRRRDYPLVIVFYSGGNFYCLYFHEESGRRKLYVGRRYQDGIWSARARFLVVGELSSGA